MSWSLSHLDPFSPSINFCRELAHLGVEGRQELKFQGELCFIMKQITPSRAGLDYVITTLLRDIWSRQDFSYLHFPPVQSGWTLSLCTLPDLQEASAVTSKFPAHRHPLHLRLAG